MRNKGRQVRGEEQWAAKLTEEQVAEIKRRYERYQRLWSIGEGVRGWLHGNLESRYRQNVEACMNTEAFRELTDPIKFGKLLWPNVQFYKQQREIIESVWQNDETFVPAANMMGV